MVTPAPNQATSLENQWLHLHQSRSRVEPGYLAGAGAAPKQAGSEVTPAPSQAASLENQLLHLHQIGSQSIKPVVTPALNQAASLEKPVVTPAPNH